ncbi:hypothetical protein [Brevibacillus laterosporus]|uniref:hypothetical protein n=1 Tax=Brevibacillus laterosporus TaxID=1465 RepID=UPI003D1AC87C
MHSHSSFAWRKEWIRWFESPWSTIEKFKYANEITSRSILGILGTPHVKKLKGAVGELNRSYLSMRGFDPILTAKVLDYDLIKMNRHYLETLFANFPHRTNENYFMNPKFVFCSECLKTGYHSHLHQVTFLQKCPIHMTPLRYKCPNCKQEFYYECNDTGFYAPFMCQCGYMFIQIERSKKFFVNWTLEKYLQEGKVIQWVSLKNEQRKIFQTLQMYPSTELQYSPHTLDGLLQAALPQTRFNSYIEIASTPKIRQIKGQKELLENKQFENIVENHVKIRFRQQKLHEDLYHFYCKVISSVARHIRKKVLTQHRTCLNRYYTDSETVPRCPFAFAYIHWRAHVEKYRNSQDVISISSPMIMKPEEVKFPFQSHNDFFEKLFSKWSLSVPEITDESRSYLKWVFGRSIADVSLSLFNQYIRYAMNNEKFYQNLYIVPFQTSNIRPFFFTIDFLSKEPPRMYLEKNQIFSTQILPVICPFQTVKSRRNPLRKHINGR